MIDSAYDKSLKSSLKKYPQIVRTFLYETLRNTPIPLLITDSKLKIISLDSLLSNKIQRDPDDLIGEHIKSICPENVNTLNKALARLKTREKTEVKHIVLKGFKNKTFQSSALINIYRKKSTELFFIYFTFLEKKKELNVLKETSRVDSFIYELTRTGKWLLDTEKRIFQGNKLCFELLGIKSPAGNINFMDVLELIPGREERELIEKDILKVNTNQQKTEREIRIRPQDKTNGGSRYIRLIFTKADFISENHIIGTIQNITDYKQIEKDLLKSRDRIEKTDKFKSIFLTNLSHEIRTPMNAILGYSELLNQPDLGENEIKNYTNIIRSKGSHLLSLIDDVIEISRFESGSIDFRYKEFLLLPLLKELKQEFDIQRKDKGKNNLEIILDVPDDADKHLIYTDFGRLQQLLSNLLSNALKFTEKGKITFGYKLSSKNYKFFVSDTGVGLNKEDKKRIFNRFESVEHTTVRKLSGTGLSLTITKHIVEELGGKIKLKSEVNKGSRFQLNIPVVKPPGGEEQNFDEKQPAPVHNWKDKVILIAEDEEVNYRFLEAILEKSQAQLLHAKNGLEAVELCKKINQIDLVLMDIKMPVANGYDATIEIKRYRSDLPIIAQTAFASREEINKCFEAGCDDYVSKPININELIEKINTQFIK
jgi:signal transduction histidine kinase